MAAEHTAALSELRLLQGDAAEALSLARAARAIGAGLRLPQLVGGTVEAEALLAAGERDAARALLAEGRAEILALAGRIEDDTLRESFLTRGFWSARLLRLAAAEGVGDAPRLHAEPAP